MTYKQSTVYRVEISRRKYEIKCVKDHAPSNGDRNSQILLWSSNEDLTHKSLAYCRTQHEIMPYGAGIAVSRSGHNLISISGEINSAVYEFAQLKLAFVPTISDCPTYSVCPILTHHGSFSQSVPSIISKRPTTATYQFV